MLLTITDETATGDITNEISVPFETPDTTVKGIIAARGTEEVNAYNNKATDDSRGLIQPSEAEQALNGFKMKKRKTVDAEKQVYIALDAFQRNGFFVFINNRQTEGDRGLSLIISKAVLLAYDHKITDSTILNQIKR